MLELYILYSLLVPWLQFKFTKEKGYYYSYYYYYTYELIEDNSPCRERGSR